MAVQLAAARRRRPTGLGGSHQTGSDSGAVRVVHYQCAALQPWQEVAQHEHPLVREGHAVLPAAVPHHLRHGDEVALVTWEGVDQRRAGDAARGAVEAQPYADSGAMAERDRTERDLVERYR